LRVSNSFLKKKNGRQVPMNLMKESSVEMGEFCAFCWKVRAGWNPVEAATRATSQISAESKGICGAVDRTRESIACCSRAASVVESVAIVKGTVTGKKDFDNLKPACEYRSYEYRGTPGQLHSKSLVEIRTCFRALRRPVWLNEPSAESGSNRLYRVIQVTSVLTCHSEPHSRARHPAVAEEKLSGVRVLRKYS